MDLVRERDRIFFLNATLMCSGIDVDGKHKERKGPGVVRREGVKRLTRVGCQE